ncbi:hypothetical protein [Thermococcus profundus]|uniref:hypothetical protein n=1 Tax=Thermococcus profundus TaxID=49899 RepID=UPI0018E0039B|nr:hypothetical protein [Thermococcus profundus]
MGEIIVTVPNGLEKILRRKISAILEKEEKKSIKKSVLQKYLGKFSGKIIEEEWYLQ